MYERFTDRARKVMQLANQEAQRRRHGYLGTEHLLLGLVLEGSGVAAHVLKNLDVEPERIRREVDAVVQHGPTAFDVPLGRLANTPRLTATIQRAIDEAGALRHNYVGTEHLLLGVAGETEGVAFEVLSRLGISPATVREEVLALLGHHVPARCEATSIDPAVRSDLLTSEDAELFEQLLSILRRKKEQFTAVNDAASEMRCFTAIQLLQHLYNELRGSD